MQWNSETIQLEFPPNCAPKVKRVESSNMFKIIQLLWSQHPGLCEHCIPLNPKSIHWPSSLSNQNCPFSETWITTYFLQIFGQHTWHTCSVCRARHRSLWNLLCTSGARPACWPFVLQVVDSWALLHLSRRETPNCWPTKSRPHSTLEHPRAEKLTVDRLEPPQTWVCTAP